MKILNSNSKNFDKNLDSLLLRRKKKVQSNSVSVSSIIKDVRKNGDKALVKYEKRFNKNTIIVPSQKQITNSIKSLDKKVKQAIDIAYNRIYKFHSLQKFKNISYVDKYKNKLEYKYLPLESVAIYVPGSTASYDFPSLADLGCIMPINLFVFILSLIISIYLGSKILRGTVVFGNIIKLLKGNTGIVFGNSSFFILNIISHLILLELKKLANYTTF